MFSTISFFVKLAASLIAVNPVLGKIKKMRDEKGDEATDKFIFEFVRNWAQKRLKYTKCNIHVKGDENIPQDKTVLFVSNHQSNLDFCFYWQKLTYRLGL